MPLSNCTILENPDGTYSITGPLHLIARIKRYQSLPASWQRRIDHLIDSVADERNQNSNVVKFPTDRRRPAATA